MSAIVYPVGLPGPQQSAVFPGERRLLSDVTGGPQQARGVQRDYLATQRLEWFFSVAEALAFDQWWKGTLAQGGAWFASTWPAPQGWVSLIRRFIGAPTWTHVPGGFWRVSAQVQMRGRGLPPQAYVNVDLDAIVNAGTSSAVGVTIAGLDPLTTYSVSQPSGRRFGAWSALTPALWENGRLNVTTAGGTMVLGSAAATYFATPQLARDAFNARNESISGYASYTLWINDTPVADNLGGLSLAIF